MDLKIKNYDEPVSVAELKLLEKMCKALGLELVLSGYIRNSHCDTMPLSDVLENVKFLHDLKGWEKDIPDNGLPWEDEADANS